MTDNQINKSAIIWCTDGGDYDYWRYSIASMRMQVKQDVDLIVITLPSDDLHNLDRKYGLMRIDPTPYMKELGFTNERYKKLGKRWPIAILYKMCVPLIGALKQYKAVMTLDTDVMAMPTSRVHTVDDVLNHPLGEFEIGGVPDLYEDLSRTADLIKNKTPDYIRKELDERVWSKFGGGCQAYISAGLFLWNIPVIDRDIDWYIRRCKAFWDNISAYIFPEQDFVNQFMAVDSRFQSTFGARADGNGPYVVADACMRHFTGIGKGLMYNMAKKIPEITPSARIAQADLHPRASDIDPNHGGKSSKRCIIWSCGTDENEIKKLRFAITSLKDVCGDKVSAFDLFVITDGPWLGQRFKYPGVRVININGLYDLSGFRSICNWRSGWISWDRNKLARLFIPFMPELRDYDLALFMESDMIVTDKRMLDIFNEDVRGYDYAMSPEYYVMNGIYYPHKHVRFCVANLQAMYDVADSNYILGRLNAGVYFSTSMFLANMAEIRKTFGDMMKMCRLGVSCVGNGAPAVEHNLLNCSCIIKPVSGAYNTAGTTHVFGDPVYCVHNYTTELKSGETYPKPYLGHYL